jgi:hypothetical protein
MPDYDFPTSPTNGDTHSIGDKTWTFNGSAWEKTFSGDSIKIVGVADINGDGVSGETFANTNELLFRSFTPGLTLSGSQTSNKTLITFDAFDIAARVGLQTTSWTYTTGTDLFLPGAGQIYHRTSGSTIAIHKLDSSGVSARETFSAVINDINDNGSSIIRLSFGDEERNYTVNAGTYDGDRFTFTISEGNDQSDGSGKSVNAGGYVDPGEAERIGASEYYRFPDGTTTETIVTSLNGLTGAVTINAGSNITVIGGAGGITIDSSDALGVSSFAAFTGDVAVGVTTDQILFHGGDGISGSGNFTFDGTDINFTTNGVIDTNDGGHHGRVVKSIKAGEALAPNDPVYITGSVGASGRVIVAKADASDSAKMPAAGVVFDSFSTNDEGFMTVFGPVRKVDTSDFSANDTIYVSPGGGITASRPTAAGDLVQNIGRAGRIDATNGTVIIGGAGRNNDVPNLLHARAGISADAGITVDGNLNVKNDFEIRNEAGNAIFDVAGTGNSVEIGDVDSAGNGNTILVRDSAGTITVTASSNIVLSSENVTLNHKLRHAADINTHLAFPANDEITLTTNGVTLAHLTDTFALQQGLSLDAAGITFPDGTFQSSAASSTTLSDVATFSIDSSSAIATGAKTKSLYRVPYDATLTNFDVRASKTGGFTAAVYIAGSDFGVPITNAVTGCSLGVSGLTGSSTTFNVSSVTAGNFLYLDVFSNNSGSTFAQAFLTFEGR